MLKTDFVCCVPTSTFIPRMYKKNHLFCTINGFVSVSRVFMYNEIFLQLFNNAQVYCLFDNIGRMRMPNTFENHWLILCCLTTSGNYFLHVQYDTWKWDACMLLQTVTQIPLRFKVCFLINLKFNQTVAKKRFMLQSTKYKICKLSLIQ